MAIYLESPDGPLANQVINGEPVIAYNWGFGIDEDGRPYFDTGIASPGQRAHLELVRLGVVAIVGGWAGPENEGPPEIDGGAWHAMLRAPLSWGERPRSRTDHAPLPPNPLCRSSAADFTGAPMARNAPQCSARAWFVGAPMPPRPMAWSDRQRRRSDRLALPRNPPSRSRSRGFTGTPVPSAAPNHSCAADFPKTPLPASPPGFGFGLYPPAASAGGVAPMPHGVPGFGFGVSPSSAGEGAGETPMPPGAPGFGFGVCP